MKKLSLFLSGVLLLVLLTFCSSEKDEPQADDFKFDTLEKIVDGKIWEPTSWRYFGSDGLEFSETERDRIPLGLGELYFSVQGNKLTNYYWVVVQHPIYSATHSYTFDRNSGEIALIGNNKPEKFLIIESVEENKIVARGYFDELYTEDYEWDEGSYILMELEPVEDEVLLDKFANAVKK